MKFAVKVLSSELEALKSKNARWKVSAAMFRPTLLKSRPFMRGVGKLMEGEKAAGRARIGADRLDAVFSCYLPNGYGYWVLWVSRELGVLPSDILRNLLRDLPLNKPLPHYSLERLKGVLGYVETPEFGVRARELARSGRLGELLKVETNRYVLREFYDHPALLDNPRVPLSILVETRAALGITRRDPLVESYEEISKLWVPQWVDE